MPMNTGRARQLLKDFDFGKLFVEELGWDRHQATLNVTVGAQSFNLAAIAHKRGMVAYHCAASAGAQIPDYALRRKIEHQVAKSAHEHFIIFTDADKKSQIWQWVKREPGKPVACREHPYNASQPGDALLQKLQAIAFSLEEEDSLSLPDVTRRARVGFDVERVTKRFYDQFQSEHAVFLKFISGITESGDHEWYASVMLNRLMFVYFMQKKRFLDGDINYLRNRLDRCKKEKGTDKFYSFYRYFLLRLFHEGLGGRKRDTELEKLIGRVPYLNGGIFDLHELEAPDRYGKTIQIPDKAFERIFSYFDQYQWHLDERPLRADNEINPDVLGYIFEKYINQKQMGAYYTKEDITEYISKNTVLPFLFDAAKPKCKVAFENPGGPTLWDLLSETPDRYIYPAVYHGANDPLPVDVVAGLKSLAKRALWNKPAPATSGLPTEIWLEVIESCEGPELLRAFWHAIEKITILDPTCGSGAFLFAALNVLEPLYEACLDRMAAFVADRDQPDGKHRPEAFSDFRKVLEHVASHPNRRYFIFKSIILNNLFGVDIMDEAVEICKLRLFLKLAAQVEPDLASNNLGIEPLPDIDFNIRTGNTLIGYTKYEEVQNPNTGSFDFDSAKEKIATKAADLQQTFDEFRKRQTERDNAFPSEYKLELRTKLKALEDELNRYLAGTCGVKVSQKSAYSTWMKAHQPFHWFIEFYSIMNRGGFDVIIGNPPYVEIPKDLNRPLLCSAFKSALERWSRDEDLYTLVVERSLRLLNPKTGQFGMILPLSVSFSTKRPFAVLRRVLGAEPGLWLWSHFDRIPSALFGNEVRTRCTIAVLSRSPEVERFDAATTSLLRWGAEYRDHLFNNLHFARLDLDISAGIPKLASQVQADVLKKLLHANAPLALELKRSIAFSDLANSAPEFPQPAVYIGGTAYNWFPAWRDIPKTTNLHGKPSLPARTVGYRFSNEENANIVFALLCSSMGYWWWAVASDGFNLKKWLLERFPITIGTIPLAARKQLAQLGSNLRRELKRYYVYKDNKGRIGNFYLPACEEQIIAIDTFLGTTVPILSLGFFEDIRNFNTYFSRAETTDEDETEDDE